MNNPRNAKEEFLRQLLNGKESIKIVKCAKIDIIASTSRSLVEHDSYNDPNPVNARLKLNHTEEEEQAFLDKLDKVYDSGFGSQELFGIVWFTDGTWLTRDEYDGSECWNHNVCPEFDEDLL
tara:strand:- start:315 stop:680 length:366 start_codon:yes stop_codon:yes gene_type:complete